MALCSGNAGDVYKATDSVPMAPVSKAAANKINREIDQKLEEEKKLLQKTVKLLLLGPGESGKSTILKQMRILHNQGFTEEELREKKLAIFATVIKSMAYLLKCMESEHSPIIDDDSLQSSIIHVTTAVSAVSTMMELRPDMAEALQDLWSNKAVRSYYNTTRLVDDVGKYFLGELEKICSSNYRPSCQDILRLRIATCGIVEIRFLIEDINFRVVDVGGQRSERRKWIHCFEGVNAIIFMVAMSDYDLMLREDHRVNRTHDALGLFDVICNSRWFAQSTMILFLNKKDLFVEKIKLVPLTVCFPEYSGSQTYEQCVAFMRKKFAKLRSEKSKQIYAHETCATDTNQVQLVLDSVVASIIRKNVAAIGLM